LKDFGADVGGSNTMCMVICTVCKFLMSTFEDHNYYLYLGLDVAATS